jgi:hypothetical protein
MKDMARDNSCLGSHHNDSLSLFSHLTGAVWVGNLKNRHIDGTEVRLFASLTIANGDGVDRRR